jgi:hypothetical protein
VLRNVYADPGLVHDHRLRARAAALLMPPEAAIGGRSAAAWFGAPFSTAVDPVLVGVPRGCDWTGPHGVQVHVTDLRPDEVWVDRQGVRVTTAARTAWEVATLESLPVAVALIDGMLRDGHQADGERDREGAPPGLTESAFAAEDLRRRGTWGSRRASRLLPLVDRRAMSPPESRVRLAVHLAGLPHPVPQFDVYEDGRFLGQVDLAWPEAKVIVEYEGSYHFEGSQIIKDDGRYERLEAAGWTVIRLLAADLRDLDSVVARIASALTVGW